MKEIIEATDTFKDAQGRCFVAGEEVTENVFNRVQELVAPAQVEELATKRTPGKLEYDTSEPQVFLVFAGLPPLQEINPAKVAHLITSMASRVANEFHELQGETLPSKDGLPEYVDEKRTMQCSVPLSFDAFV